MRAKWFLAPAFLGFCLATLAPVLALLGSSGLSWNLINTPTWVGLENFFDVLGDDDYVASIYKTLWLAVLAVTLQVGIGSGIGYLLANWTKTSRNLASIFLLPWLSAPIALGVIWRWLLAPTGGLLSTALGFRLDLLSNSFWSPIAVAVVIAWCGVGFTALVFASALRTVQANTVSAARIDGAGSLKILWHIQLPQIRRVLFFIIATTTLQAMASYDIVLMLTGGGPSLATDTASLHIINAALNTFQVGSAAAMSIVFSLVELIVLLLEYLVYKLVTRRFND